MFEKTYWSAYWGEMVDPRTCSGWTVNEFLTRKSDIRSKNLPESCWRLPNGRKRYLSDERSLVWCEHFYKRS